MGGINRTVKVTSLPEQALSQSKGRAHQLTLGGLDDFFLSNMARHQRLKVFQ